MPLTHETTDSLEHSVQNGSALADHSIRSASELLLGFEQEHARFVKSSNRVKNITFPIDLLITILVIPLLVVMLKHSNAQLTMITLVWFYRSFLAEP